MKARSILGIIFALGITIGLALLFVTSPQPDIQLTVTPNFNVALWEFRSLDIFGQLVIILVGTFTILTLVKERGSR